MVDRSHGTRLANDSPAQLETAEEMGMLAVCHDIGQPSFSDLRQLELVCLQHSPYDTRHDSVSGPCSGLDTSDDCDAISPRLESDIRSLKKRTREEPGISAKTDGTDATETVPINPWRDRGTRLEPEKKRQRETRPERSEKLPVKHIFSDEARLPDCAQGGASGVSCSVEQKHAPVMSSERSCDVTSGSAASDDVKMVVPAMPATEPKPRPTSTQVPKLTFGNKGGVSPFAELLSKTHGRGTWKGGSFASTERSASAMASQRATRRPFGAPDNDIDDSEIHAEPDGDDDSQTEEPTGAVTPERDADEKRKSKLHRVIVDDGEAKEATLVSVRAKMFSLDKNAGWKERGAGMLKVNVPRSSVEFDDLGVPISGSFDASGIVGTCVEERDAKYGLIDFKSARLIMRQDQTHRVILNTIIFPAMQFQTKATLKSVGVLFTALEGEEARPVSITMKMSAANARNFLRKIEIVQKSLKNNY